MNIQRSSNRVMNLGHFLTQSANRLKDSPALIRGDHSVSFGELNRRVNSACRALQGLGIGKGDRILVQSRNSFAMFETMFAAFRLGAVWVPVNFRLLEDEVAFIAEHSGAKVLVYDPVFKSHRDAAKKQGELEHVISLGEADAGELAWNELVVEDVVYEECAVDHNDPCWFFFTSGTTGRPKAAVLTHGQMGFVITNYLADLFPGLGPSDASLIVAPLSHGAGIHQIAQVARGVVSVFLDGERFDTEQVFALIERHKITNAFTVPTILKTMADSEAVDRYDHSSLRHLIYAGSPTYRVDQQKALEKLGPCIVQYFGLGEVTGNITVLPSYLHHIDDEMQGHIGSCGYARSAMQVEIQDAEGARMPIGETGEICVIGPAVFSGYYDNPQANEKAFRNGWFRTGDRGHMDEQGFVYITGRESDMYISGGSNIYPREIEEKIMQHPQVRECAIVGMPDPKWGEVGALALVAESDLDLDEFTAWMASKIASYKLPRRVELFEQLPTSGYGKVTKILVREAILARDE
ncbi:MAG: AMP-binding protein [Rhizobiaceae bacterium]|nr:AMP-binding protein [Rhizobiaceae bacterium]